MKTEPATKSDLREVELRMNARLDKQDWMINILVALAVANFAKQFF